jgi:hypothetical protein
MSDTKTTAGEMVTVRRMSPLGVLEIRREPMTEGVIPAVTKVIVGEIPEAFDEFSGTWVFMKKLIERRLETIRKQNDNFLLGERETALLRGQVMILKELAKTPETLKGREQRPQTDRPFLAGEEY